MTGRAPVASSLPIGADRSRTSDAPPSRAHAAFGVLVIGALGVVYGDIGTSPLYTLKTAYEWAGSSAPDVALGLLSLIVWTLIITTSIKYVALVMRADNDGEGGILALMARVGMKQHGSGRIRPGKANSCCGGCEFRRAPAAGCQASSPTTARYR